MHDCDVVFMTYEQLRKEMGFADRSATPAQGGHLCLDAMPGTLMDFHVPSQQPFSPLPGFLFGSMFRSATPLIRSDDYRSVLLGGRSLLLQFGFWRVVLDEAQLVASSSSVAAVMCSALWRRTAWVVTGTPITSKIEEIQVISQRVERACRSISEWIPCDGSCISYIHASDCPVQLYINVQ
jgi:SNF2 family DNA or RNA helicase